MFCNIVPTFYHRHRHCRLHHRGVAPPPSPPPSPPQPRLITFLFLLLEILLLVHHYHHQRYRRIFYGLRHCQQVLFCLQCSASE